jgi:hypothetical protein
LTTTWTAGGGYEHYWLPNVSTAVYGSYTQVRYNDTVINSGMFCNVGPATTQSIVVTGVTCDPGFNFWQVGMVNNWYPVAGFRLAVDVLYTRVETAFSGDTISLSKAQGARPTGSYLAKDEGILSVMFRAQRNFVTE